MRALVGLLLSLCVAFAGTAPKKTVRKGTAAKTAPRKTAKSKASAAKSTRKTKAKQAAETEPPVPPVSRFPAAAPGSLQALAHAYRDKQIAGNAAPLERYAKEHAGTQSEGMANLALAASEVEHGSFDSVASRAAVAQKRLGEIADYAAFFAASAFAARGQSAEAETALKPLWEMKPQSPLEANAAVLLAKSYVDGGQPAKALAILDKYSDDIPAPRAALATGKALEAAGRKSDAVRQYQAIYYDFPLAGEAAEAGRAIVAICAASSCPDVPGSRVVSRAQALFDGGQAGQAQSYLEVSLPKLTGADRDAAHALLGASLFTLKRDAAALAELRTPLSASQEADAQRLFYLARLQERSKRPDLAMEAVRALDKDHPKSEWRQKTLIEEGNRRVVDNSPSEYLPLFRACYESFPDTENAAYCHWKIAWNEYLNKRSSAADAFKTHLRNYSASVKANAALYFLGRIAETGGNLSAARSWYSAVADRYPNSYYAMLSRDRLKQAAVSRAQESPEVQTFLGKIPKPILPAADGFEPNPATLKRINRSKLLASAGLEDYAERELRFAAENDGQPQVIAMELAAQANHRDAPDQAIRYIKRYVPGYLNLPLQAAPGKFWQLAFPLPYRKALEQYCNEHSLDPYFVAALIRQESEFNTRAVSVAKALGLTQVMPSTGKYLSQKLNMHRFTAKLLFEPEINLKIGTYYLRVLLDGLQGSEEAALASYNAGKSRVVNWLTWSNYKEPAEFVESIPFLQTREYVQVVMHNADIYRRVYSPSGSSSPAVASLH